MFILWGSRLVRIGKHFDPHIRCENCGNFSQNFFVFRKYIHFFFIPLFPIGQKIINSECVYCKDTFNGEKKTHYLHITKTPVYFYTGIILFITLILYLIAANIHTQKQKKEYIENPQKGDIYLIREDKEKQATYYYVKIKSIEENSVELIRNRFTYDSFVSSMNNKDYFIEEQSIFIPADALKEMLGKGRIISVERGSQ
ncbi:MAG: zinc ribbon domain-containing protein [Candidatus Azobacteroides sp.]|nr:zinc ribbon domain-containing protein [Candidatus Azobacteroides sp.]